jgi:hypothetical protein
MATLPSVLLPAPSKKKTKLALPLRLAYSHAGSSKDYPLRIAVSGSAHFEACGKDLDLLFRPAVEERPSHRKSSGEGGGGGGGGWVFLDATLILKYDASVASAVHYSSEEPWARGGNGFLSHHACLTFNVCCSVGNDYGRPCWRDGGTCHVSLLELLTLEELRSEDRGGTNANRSYATHRRIENSGYGVADRDRLTGVLGVSLRGAPMVYRCDGKGETPVPVADPCRRFFGITNRLRTSFSSRLEVEDVDDEKRSEVFRRMAAVSHAEYEEMLRWQSQKVEITERSTKNMRCPWTPMDTCVWESFSDYAGTGVDGSDWIKVSKRQLVAGEATERVLGRQAEGRECSVGATSEKVLRIDVQRMASKIGTLEEVTEKIGGGGGGGHRRLRFEGGDSGGDARWGDDDLSRRPPEKRVYLPFFAYLMCHPLQVYRGYWENALKITIERKGYASPELYESSRWRVCKPSIKVADAFQMICNYAQAIEYIPDYYQPGDGSDKREIEQFWNPLRAECGDCDDLSLGHAQFYRAFVVHSWSRPKVNAEIANNRILSEMRSLLANNYVMFLNIEAVYLPRQKVSASDPVAPAPFEEEDMTWAASGPGGSSPIGYYGATESFAAGNYLRDTRGMNSAHAAIKLLPKRYFERCVNRSGSSGNRPVFGASASGRSPDRGMCCFYHSHPPDVFNDDLPVLFGEGTSMLTCCDEEEDPCDATWFKKSVFSDSFLNDVTKSPIYAKKGKSNFYKASLFGATLEFLDNHRAATFTYARPKVRTRSSPSSFARGVSHHQLSFKSESVVLVPYGVPSSSVAGETPINNVTVRGVNPCEADVIFETQEMGSFMPHVCSREAKKRIRARKIKRPPSSPPNTRDDRFPVVGTNAVVERYNVLIHDTRLPLEESGRLLERWRCELNSAMGNLSMLSDSTNGNVFRLYVDNYYVTEDFLSRLESRIWEGFRRRCQPCRGDGGEFSLSAASLFSPSSSSSSKGEEDRRLYCDVRLDSFSEDLRVWRLSFYFFPRNSLLSMR